MESNSKCGNKEEYPIGTFLIDIRTDMGNQAYELFKKINDMRANPTSFGQGLDPFAADGLGSLMTSPKPKFEWSNALSDAARHVANEEGACNTYGDANGNDIEKVLKKYYSFHLEGLEVLKVTSEELFDVNDPDNSDQWALEYILS